MARLATRLFIDAIRRLVEADGGFAAILAKGDAIAGELLLRVEGRGNAPRLLGQMPGNGGPVWTDLVDSQADDAAAAVDAWVQRARARDPDLWILELTVADSERLVRSLPIRD